MNDFLTSAVAKGKKRFQTFTSVISIFTLISGTFAPVAALSAPAPSTIIITESGVTGVVTYTIDKSGEGDTPVSGLLAGTHGNLDPGTYAVFSATPGYTFSYSPANNDNTACNMNGLGAGQTDTCIVTVALAAAPDNTAPILTLPDNITVEDSEVDGEVVTFVATATDENPTNPVVICNPASGSTFNVGTTPVNCSATDTAGNTVTGSFTVTVTVPTEQPIETNLTLITVIDGGTATTGDFTYTAIDHSLDESPVVPGVANVTEGSYLLTTGHNFVINANFTVANYDLSVSDSSCNGIIFPMGASKSCTYTYTYTGGNGNGPTGTLVIEKIVEDSEAEASSFTFNVTKNGDGTEDDLLGVVANSYELAPGAYDVVETNGRGYTTTYVSGNGDCTNISVSPGQTTTCTVTNKFIEEGGGGGNVTTATLTVTKLLDNGQGEPEATSTFDEYLHVTKGATVTDIDSGVEVELEYGIYAVTEDDVEGYEMTDLSCVRNSEEGAVTLSMGEDQTLTLDAGEDYDCTIINSPSRDGGGDGEEGSGTITIIVDGLPVSLNDAVDVSIDGEGVEQDEANEATEGEHVIGSDIPSAFNPQLSCIADFGEQSYTVELGGEEGMTLDVDANVDYICTFTFDARGFVWAEVRVNNRGDMLDEEEILAWIEEKNLQVWLEREEMEHASVMQRLLDVLIKPAYAAISVPLTPGTPYYVGGSTYAVFSSDVSGYSVSFSAGCSATLNPDEAGVCVITFNKKGGGSSSNGNLTVVTEVINDNGGALAPGDVSMSLNAIGMSSTFAGFAVPGLSFSIPAGDYAVTSPAVSGYDRTDSSCSGSMSSGSTITCTVTYNDVEQPQTPPTEEPAPTVPTPTVLGATDSETDSTAAALPRTGGSALPLVFSAICAAIAVSSRKRSS